MTNWAETSRSIHEYHTDQAGIVDLLDPANVPENPGERATYYQETVLPAVTQALEAHGGLTYELKDGGGAFDAGSYLGDLSTWVTNTAETDRSIHEYHTAEGAILDLLDPANVPEDPGERATYYQETVIPRIAQALEAHGGLSLDLKDGGMFNAGDYLGGLASSVTTAADTANRFHAFQVDAASPLERVALKSSPWRWCGRR